MASQQEPKQHSLFPTRDTIEEVFEEAKAQLPITCENQLVAILQMHHNTVVNIMEQRA